MANLLFSARGRNRFGLKSSRWLAEHGDTGVDGECLAGHQGATVGGDEERSADQVGRLEDTTERGEDDQARSWPTQDD
jgi:hypothetical protein